MELKFWPSRHRAPRALLQAQRTERWIECFSRAVSRPCFFPIQQQSLLPPLHYFQTWVYPAEYFESAYHQVLMLYL